MLEANLYPDIRRMLRKLTPAVFKIPGTPYAEGLPDFICVINGCAVHLEVKLRRPDKPYKATELQKEHLLRVHEAGGIGYLLVYDQRDQLWHLVGPEDGFKEYHPKYQRIRKELDALIQQVYDDRIDNKEGR